VKGTPYEAESLEPIIPQPLIERRLDELAAEISRDYAGRDLVVVGVLRASFIFVADLVRRVNLPLRVEFLTASSYGDGTTPQGPVSLAGEWTPEVRGRDCLLVDVVLDTGRTLSAVRRRLLDLGPRSLAACVLAVKEGAQEVEVPVRYLGFRVPRRFLVGYGLDHAQRYRNLPYLAALRE